MNLKEKRLKDLIILIKGGGEMASGIALRLVRSGFRVCITEIPHPLAVRRGVSFCEAVFELRGILHDGLTAEPNMKVGDVDPRAAPENCLTVSDKARAIAGGVLEAILMKCNH